MRVQAPSMFQPPQLPTGKSQTARGHSQSPTDRRKSAQARPPSRRRQAPRWRQPPARRSTG